MNIFFKFHHSFASVDLSNDNRSRIKLTGVESRMVQLMYHYLCFKLNFHSQFEIV